MKKISFLNIQERDIKINKDFIMQTEQGCHLGQQGSNKSKSLLDAIFNGGWAVLDILW